MIGERTVPRRLPSDPLRHEGEQAVDPVRVGRVEVVEGVREALAEDRPLVREGAEPVLAVVAPRPALARPAEGEVRVGEVEDDVVDGGSAGGVFSAKYSWLSAFVTAWLGLLLARLRAACWP